MFYLRAASLIASSALRRKNSPIKDFLQTQLSLRVWPHEADLHFVNTSTYLQYFEVGRIGLMLQCRFFWKMLREHLFAPIHTMHLQFQRPMRRFQKFSVTSKIFAWDERYIFVIQGIHVDSKCIALAFVKSVVKSGRTTTVSPATLFETLDVKATPELEEANRKFAHGFTGSARDFSQLNEKIIQ